MRPTDKAGGGGGDQGGGGACCPVCGRPGDAAYRPFCSRRCADVDLGRWLTGRYAIPGPAADRGPRQGEGDDG